MNGARPSVRLRLLSPCYSRYNVREYRAPNCGQPLLSLENPVQEFEHDILDWSCKYKYLQVADKYYSKSTQFNQEGGGRWGTTEGKEWGMRT